MSSNRAYAIIGAFIVGVIVLVTVGVLIFGSAQIFSPQRRAVIFFDQSVLGLSKGGRVLFRGVKIGTVQRVELRVSPDINHARIAVTISMPDKSINLRGRRHPVELSVSDLVERGLRAQLVIYSYVTSELAVNLSFKPQTSVNYIVDPDKLELPEIPAIQSDIAKLKSQIISLPWRQTFHRINTTMKAVINLSRDLARAVDELQPQLQQTAESTQKTLQTVRQAVEANNKQLQATMKQVRQLARSVTQLSGTANRNIKARSDQLQQVLVTVHKTTEQLNRLITNLNTLVAPGKRPRHDIENILRDLAATAANLREFTQKITRNPQALLLGG